MTSSRFNGLNVRQMQSGGDEDGVEDSDEEEAKQEVTDILANSPPLPRQSPNELQ